MLGGPSLQTMPDRFTFEISWEVCNKVGGINTVIRSKAAVTVQELGENYYLLGPYVEEKMRTEVEIAEPDDFYVRAAVEAMRCRGVKVVTGTWLIEGTPKVILFDIASSWRSHDEWMRDFWNVTHIVVPDSDKESFNCIMFGELVCWFFGEFVARYQSKRIVAHFHEWQAGVACILARTRGLELATIFTTHATLLGRYLCAGSTDFYNNMAYFDCEGEARQRGIHHRYCIEVASCHAAHTFTTVSRITQDEAEHLLKRRPDIITPNGLNVHKFSATHEFQNLHALAKQKIHNFVQGHFYGHLDFELDNVIYMFSAGRNEYFNKGVDVYLESLAKLNYYLKVQNVDVTIIAFLIFPDSTNNYNIDSLNGQAQHKKLRESVEKIQHNIGEKIFQAVLRGQMPGEKLLTRDDEVLLKNYLYRSKRTTLPPIVTHNLIDEAKSDIMNHIKRIQLFNNHHDKVKIIYHPEFLSSTSPLFNIDYSEFVRGCHLGVFPSYYEPWGYTPAECTVMGIPSITTNLSGFGCFMAEHIADPTSYGIYIVDRRFKSPGDSVEQLAQQMLAFSKQSRRQRVIQRNRTERLSDLLDWNSLGMYYIRARHMALKALDPSYQIPSLTGDIIIDQGVSQKKPSNFSYPRPASQPPSPSHSRRSSVNMDSDEEDMDKLMIEEITRKILNEGTDKPRRHPEEHNFYSSFSSEEELMEKAMKLEENIRNEKNTFEEKRDEGRQKRYYSMGDIMDIKHNVLGEAMQKVKTKENKRNIMKEIHDLSAVRPIDDVSLINVQQRDQLLKCVNKEIYDITETKEKKRSLIREVEDRGETKDNKAIVLSELSKIAQVKDSSGANENVNLANIQSEMKKKDAALVDIALIGHSKEKKLAMQRELTTISSMRDAKADAMQEIRDRTNTIEKKKSVMEDITMIKAATDARCNVVTEINQIGDARSAKERTQLELTTIAAARINKETMQNELKDKNENDCMKSVMSDIEAKGVETEQGKQNVKKLIERKVSEQEVFSGIRDIGKAKADGKKSVEQLFAAKSGRANVLDDIKLIQTEKEAGRATVEKLLEARSSKSDAMKAIREIKEEKDQGIQQLEATLGKKLAPQ